LKTLYLVSACLAGASTRFDGQASPEQDILSLVREGRAIPICPEQLGGLTTPRLPAEIIGGHGGDVLDGKARVINSSGEDVTTAFIEGAQEAERLAEKWQIGGAILKSKSPSCGLYSIYDGSFGGRLQQGPGVTAALLEKAGLKLFDENTWRAHIAHGRLKEGV